MGCVDNDKEKVMKKELSNLIQSLGMIAFIIFAWFAVQGLLWIAALIDTTK